MIRKILILTTLLVTGSVSAEVDGPASFSVDWYTMDGGGGRSTGGIYTVTGTIGQPDAAFGGASGAIYGFVGGFWGGPIEFLLVDGFEGP